MSLSFRYIKNKRLISQSCYNFIHHWEGYAPGPPCSDILIRHIERYMDENKDKISALRDTDADFRKFVINLIASISYEVIVSFLYSGPVCRTLECVHKSAMDELLYCGYISQRDYDNDKKSLVSDMKEHAPQFYKDLSDALKRLHNSYNQSEKDE